MLFVLIMFPYARWSCKGVAAGASTELVCTMVGAGAVTGAASSVNDRPRRALVSGGDNGISAACSGWAAAANQLQPCNNQRQRITVTRAFIFIPRTSCEDDIAGTVKEYHGYRGCAILRVGVQEVGPRHGLGIIMRGFRLPPIVVLGRRVIGRYALCTISA